MKKYILLLIAAGLAACTKGLDPMIVDSPAEEESRVELELYVDEGTKSPIDDTEFKDGDTFGIYLIRESNDELEYSNLRGTYNASTRRIVPGYGINLYSYDCQCFVYYPYSSDATSKKLTETVLSGGSCTDQPDFMYAVEKGINATNYSSKLTFSHQLTRITFNIQKEKKFTKDCMLSAVALKANDGKEGLPVTAEKTMPYYFDDTLSFGNIEYSNIGKLLAYGENTTLDFMFFPCTLEEGQIKAVFTVNGTDVSVDVPAGTYAAGKQKTYDVIIPTVKSDYNLNDLSANGTANCYMVSKSGTYSFNANVKGGSTEALDGTPYSAEVLWESVGTTSAPKTGTVISSVSFSNNLITFSTPSTLVDGNAVIAVKDKSGTILWSWHIWVCDGYDANTYAQVYNHDAGTYMDRNLGATSATPGQTQAIGLLYQWGRKDPFMAYANTSYDKIKSTGKWSYNTSTISNGTISFSIQNPMTEIGKNSYNQDWLYSGSSTIDNTRWPLDTKGVYDPCPYGWKVPSSYKWHTALNTYSPTLSIHYDSANNGMNFGTNASSTENMGNYPIIWYPLDGKYAEYWTCTPSGDTDYASAMHMSLSTTWIYPICRSNGGNAAAYFVRCVKFITAPVPSIK